MGEVMKKKKRLDNDLGKNVQENEEESKEGEKEQDDIKTKKGKVSESFQERNKKHEKEDQILIKKSIQNGEETAKFEDTKDENEIIEKETKKKVSSLLTQTLHDKMLPNAENVS